MRNPLIAKKRWTPSNPSIVFVSRLTDQLVARWIVGWAWEKITSDIAMARHPSSVGMRSEAI
jgi:hypothetical protein